MKLFRLLLVLYASYITEGAKILAIFPYQGRSHNIMFEPLMIGLARAGHSVDVVSHFVPKEIVPGFNHISLEGTLHFYVNNMTVSAARQMGGVFGALNFISYREPKDLCNLMRLPQLQNIINTDTKYDVMITETFGTNCYLAVAYKLKLPVIGVISSTTYPWGYDPFFSSENPSYMPSQLSSFSNKMNFIERVENFYTHILSKLLFYYYDKTVSEPLARKYVQDFPSLREIYDNVSLVLVNSHRSVYGVHPVNPAIVEVAGLHIDEKQVLTKELEDFLDSATDGVVYFSMGSMVKSETFSPGKIQAIYDSFSDLRNYKVLWKGKEEEMPEGLPSNVKMLSWIPQYAVLRHPKVKAFVTHGGLMGTQEAIHAGVPMIGIPLFADQIANIMIYASKGLVFQLDYENLSKLTFSEALREVLTNPTYKSNVERYSKLFKDRPLSAMDEAIYWIEYVIRNGGEPLKSSARHLYWFQYYLIDVGLFLLVLTTSAILIIFSILVKLTSFLGRVACYYLSMKSKTA